MTGEWRRQVNPHQHRQKSRNLEKKLGAKNPVAKRALFWYIFSTAEVFILFSRVLLTENVEF